MWACGRGWMWVREVVVRVRKRRGLGEWDVYGWVLGGFVNGLRAWSYLLLGSAGQCYAIWTTATHQM